MVFSDPYQRNLSEVRVERDDLQAQLTSTRADIENTHRELASTKMLLAAEQTKNMEIQNSLKEGTTGKITN